MHDTRGQNYYLCLALHDEGDAAISTESEWLWAPPRRCMAPRTIDSTYIAELSVDSNMRIRIHRIVVALDVGPIIDLAGSEAQAQGASTDALSTAMGLKINIENGLIQEQNYNAYPILRLPFAPMTIDAYFIQSENPPTGMGEPAFPALAPALGNAIFAATGERVRRLPLRDLGYSLDA